MPVRYMKLERSGSFEAPHMIPTAAQCDAMATNSYRYEVTITTGGKKFTPENFIINNEDVQKFFDRQFGRESGPWHAISCEKMAIRAGEFFCRKLIALGVDVVEVGIGIYGSNGARITAYCGPEGKLTTKKKESWWSDQTSWWARIKRAAMGPNPNDWENGIGPCPPGDELF